MADASPAVFLDRDGVINADHGFVGSTKDFVLVEGAAQAVALLNRSGYLVFVVTNQSGIGQGYFSEADYKAVTEYMNLLLSREGAHINDIRHCPYHPYARIAQYRSPHHPWRKPAPGMLLDIMQNWDIDLGSSFLIGDSARDVDAASAAGISGYLFKGGNLLTFLRSIKPELMDLS